MTKRQLIGNALIDAALWQESFAAVWGEGCPERSAAEKRAAEYRREAKKMGFSEREFAGEAVALKDIPLSECGSSLPGKDRT